VGGGGVFLGAVAQDAVLGVEAGAGAGCGDQAVVVVGEGDGGTSLAGDGGEPETDHFAPLEVATERAHARISDATERSTARTLLARRGSPNIVSNDSNSFRTSSSLGWWSGRPCCWGNVGWIRKCSRRQIRALNSVLDALLRKISNRRDTVSSGSSTSNSRVRTSRNTCCSLSIPIAHTRCTYREQ